MKLFIEIASLELLGAKLCAVEVPDDSIKDLLEQLLHPEPNTSRGVDKGEVNGI